MWKDFSTLYGTDFPLYVERSIHSMWKNKNVSIFRLVLLRIPVNMYKASNQTIFLKNYGQIFCQTAFYDYIFAATKP